MEGTATYYFAPVILAVLLEAVEFGTVRCPSCAKGMLQGVESDHM